MYNRIEGMSIVVRIEKNDFCPFGSILCIAGEGNFPYDVMQSELIHLESTEMFDFKIF